MMIWSKFYFSVTAACTTIFIVTILAMIAMLVGDPDTPINIWFNKNGTIVMTIEVIAIGFFGLAAMIADRRETLRDLQKKDGADKPT